MNIQEKNILIAEWLKWHKTIEGNNHITFYNSDNIGFRWYELEFHSDCNLQWLCLEKIAKDNSCSIGVVLQTYLFKFEMSAKLYSKQDLFEAIVNYIQNEKNLNNSRI